MNNKGETLIELLVSLALFALIVTMLAIGFQTSTTSFYTNITTKRDLNEQVAWLVEEESVEKVQNLTIQYQHSTADGIYADSFMIEMLKPTEGSMYKFRELEE